MGYYFTSYMERCQSGRSCPPKADVTQGIHYMQYYTYVIKSTTTGKLYTGHTENVKRRLDEHNEFHGRYTSGKGPWLLVYTEEFATRAEAMKREKYLKTGIGRKYLKEVFEKLNN